MSNKQEMLYGICMVALALQLTAISTEHWGLTSATSSELKIVNAVIQTLTKDKKDEVDGLDLSIGLWKLCGEDWGKLDKQSLDSEICAHLPIEGVKKFPKNSLNAIRVFSLMGVVLIFTSLMCMMYGKNYKRCQLVCLLAGGLCSVIANIIWASEMNKVVLMDGLPAIKFSPGYSFYLNLAGGLAGLAAGAYYYYGK
jgi:hypothetical protein